MWIFVKKMFLIVVEAVMALANVHHSISSNSHEWKRRVVRLKLRCQNEDIFTKNAEYSEKWTLAKRRNLIDVFCWSPGVMQSSHWNWRRWTEKSISTGNDMLRVVTVSFWPKQPPRASHVLFSVGKKSDPLGDIESSCNVWSLLVSLWNRSRLWLSVMLLVT